MTPAKVLCVSSHTTYPPRAGGHLRTHHLNLGFVEHGWDVTQFSAALRKHELRRLRSFEFEIRVGYREYRYFNPLLQASNVLLESRHWPPLGFCYFPGWLFRPQRLRRELQRADVAIVEHPWLVAKVAAANRRRIPLVHNSQNIEWTVYQDFFAGAIGRRVGALARSVEAAAFRSADLNFVCSQQDKAAAVGLFGVDPDTIEIVPNGVEMANFPSQTTQLQQEAKARLGLSGKHLVLFIGSKYPPNVEAVRRIAEFARAVQEPDVLFLVAGSVGDQFQEACRDRPGNMRVTGRVEDVTPYLQAADVAINPMAGGSGTNIKMLEYMACGLPVVSTATGARGLGITDGESAIIATLGDHPDVIRTLLRDNSRRHQLGEAARAFVLRHYDWKIIQAQAIGAIERLMARKT